MLTIMVTCRAFYLDPQCSHDCMPACNEKGAPLEDCEDACAEACAKAHEGPGKGPLSDYSVKDILRKIFG
ncbi:hypothetical protein FRX31_017901 [Thalictrum thalictroides]|uniref:Uncharacterized protein n=1 Tax=Thalictrum thalictroides TaxID=46969 RepID=A0A7J6W5P1_THATH|nr:hypothetical protein FRX31_017901 [Thalictrum thalictroides]